MFTKTKKLVALSALLGAMALGACGDDDDDGGGDAPTKAEFVAQADKICKENQDKINDKAKALGENPSGQQVADFLKDDGVPAQEDTIERVRDLTPPEGQEAAVDTLLKAVESGLEEFRAASEDPDKATALLQGDDPFEEANRLAKEFGLKECGD